MVAFLSTLPNPDAKGYGIKPVDQVMRTEMEVGAARTRRRTFTRNDKISVSWTLKDAQLTAFRAWFDDPAQCAGGASWFTINLAIGTGGLVSVTAKFVGSFNPVHLGGLRWQVTAQLEVR